MKHIAATVIAATPALDIDAFSRPADRLRDRKRLLAIVTALSVAAAGLLAVGAARAETPAVDVIEAAVADAPVELAALSAACDAGDAVACNDLGVSYEHGYSVPPDSRASATLFEHACNGGVPDACSNLGALHERASADPARLHLAVQLYRRACHQQSALGCSNLGALYARGAGMAVDRDEAQRLFSLACAGGSATGCRNLEATVTP